MPCFRLTKFALTLHNQEQSIYGTHEDDLIERLSRVLMMTKNKMLPLQSIHPLKWDLGLPDGFDRNLVRKYPDHFQFVKASNGLLSLKLGQWREELAVCQLQKSNDRSFRGEYRQFKRGQTALAFSMNFPRGYGPYGAQKKVKEWTEEFQKLLYISPYEDSSRIDPNSELMEKRVVGVLHKFLSLSVNKKTLTWILMRINVYPRKKVSRIVACLKMATSFSSEVRKTVNVQIVFLTESESEYSSCFGADFFYMH